MYVKLCVQMWKVTGNKYIYFFYPQCNLWFSTQILSFTAQTTAQTSRTGLATENGTASNGPDPRLKPASLHLCSVQMLKEYQKVQRECVDMHFLSALCTRSYVT